MEKTYIELELEVGEIIHLNVFILKNADMGRAKFMNSWLSQLAASSGEHIIN